mgnify:FL=1
MRLLFRKTFCNFTLTYFSENRLNVQSKSEQAIYWQLRTRNKNKSHHTGSFSSNNQKVFITNKKDCQYLIKKSISSKITSWFIKKKFKHLKKDVLIISNRLSWKMNKEWKWKKIWLTMYFFFTIKTIKT